MWKQTKVVTITDNSVVITAFEGGAVLSSQQFESFEAAYNHLMTQFKLWNANPAYRIEWIDAGVSAVILER